MSDPHAALDVIWHWLRCIRSTIRLGDPDASYRITVGLVRRVRELGLISEWPKELR